MRGGKTTLWEGGHRVPCFIRWPNGKLRVAGDVPGLGQAQDILPTLLELCGAKTPPNVRFDGISLTEVLRGRSVPPADRTLVVRFSRMDHPSPTRGDACVMWRSWRLVQDKELFDLRTDPVQERNLFGQYPEVVARLREHYTTW
jgi:arylsulfatase A-like enzyme